MPSIKWCTVQGEGVGSVRTVMSFGGTVDERLEVLDHKNFVWSYRIMDPHALPMKGGFGTWKLQSVGENKTKATWIADAEEVDDDGMATIQPIFAPFMKESLTGLKKALAKVEAWVDCRYILNGLPPSASTTWHGSTGDWEERVESWLTPLHVD